MSINIIMYHYVRNNEDYIYDSFCRRKEEFESQVQFFLKDGIVLNPFDQESIDFYLKNDERNIYLLTFDDGYKDHFYCSKYLASLGLRACFFAPINSISGDLLDVNAIHILIGTRYISVINLLENIKDICIDQKFTFIQNNQKVSIEEYIEKFTFESRFDKRENLILKRILQRDLVGEKNRKFLINHLLEKFLKKNPDELNKEIYLNYEEMIDMKKIGMFFGSHGNTHRWLNSINKYQQEVEIEKSFQKLKQLKLIDKEQPLVMSYPYGGFNDETMEIMSDLDINYGMTTNGAKAEISNNKNSKFTLSRWDTNDCWDNSWRKPINPNSN